jgi:RNA polymerase sigma-70 factor (ECF subfamily)
MAAPDAERLFRELGDVVLRRARQMLRSEDEAREALQEIFATLLARPPRWAEIPSPVAFLYGVTTHHCLNRIRARRTRDRLLARRGPELAASARPRAEDGAVVLQLLERMPEELAVVSVYAFVDEMSQAEIAELLGCSRRHVGNLLERAREWVAREERRSA